MENTDKFSPTRQKVPSSATNLFGKALKDVEPSKKFGTFSRKLEEKSQSSSEVRKKSVVINSELLKKLRSIICKGIPDELNEKGSLLDHFSKFGNVTRMTCNKAKQYVIVHYKTHEEAREAKNKGHMMGSIKLSINWKQPDERRRKKSKDEEVKNPSESENITLNSANMKQSKRYEESFKPDPTYLKQLATQATSDAEKYEMLNSRDKVLRAYNKYIKDDSVNSKIFCGSCPDMCPEKERYGRQVKKQLSLFEYLSSSQPGEYIVNHRLAIKEYSRSSADQEEPLPHELRPAPVLEMTMDYLICNYMDLLGDAKLNIASSDWFDFLWNRTRAIRKDITQQHLCNLQVVGLIEKCTRFHIYCSERLCEEDMMSFDPKINNENLTKCMQTLKHFYYDLSVKSISCPNEAEFRSYDILLNLSRGEILREIQQYGAEIRKSAHVKFAMSVLNSFNSNNFSRFFKLLNQGSFLHACIMHRYFTEVRSKALQMMTRSHCPTNHSIQYPLNDLGRNLGFENAADVTTFCNAHGLASDESFVTMNKSQFCYPEDALLLKRAKNLIETKLCTTIGEAINGCSLPQNPMEYYEPNDSFLPNGYLKPEILLNLQTSLEKSNSDISIAKSNVSEQHVAVPSPSQVDVVKQDERIQENLILEAAFENVGELINGVCAEICDRIARQVLTSFKEMEKNADQILINLVSEIMRDCCSKELLEATLKHKEQQELDRQKKLAFMNLQIKASNSIIDDIVEDICQEEAYKISEAEMKNIEKILHNRSENKCIIELSDEIIESTVSEVISKLSSQIHQTHVVLVKQKSEALRKKVSLRLMRKYFRSWYRKHVLSTRFKIATQKFPSGPSSLSIHDQCKMLGKNIPTPSFDEIEEMNKKYDKLLDLRCVNQFLLTEMMSSPLNIPLILQDSLPSIQNKYVDGDTCFWKICLSIPDDADEKLINWLENKLTRGLIDETSNHPKLKTLSLYSANISNKMFSFDKMGVCVKSIKGLPNPEIIKDFVIHGSSGFILLLHTDRRSLSASLKNCSQRLEFLLKNKPLRPSIPITILLSGNLEIENATICEAMNIEKHKKSGYISSIKICKLNNSIDHPENVQLLIDSIKWLGENCPTIPKISSLSAAEFIEKFVFHDPLMKIRDDEAQRKMDDLTQQDPNVVIDLINHCIDHMSSIDNLGAGLLYSWPPGEFCGKHMLPPKNWSTDEVANQIPKILEILKLNRFPSFSSWDDAFECTNDYVASHKLDGYNNADLVSRVNYLMEYTIRRMKKDTYILDADSDLVTELLPWTDLIVSIVDYFINCLHKNANNQPKVYFIENQIRLPKLPSFWLNSTSLLQRKSSIKCSQVLESIGKRKYESQECDARNTKFRFIKSNLQNEADELASRLLAEIQSERMKNDSFDEKLMEAEKEDGRMIDSTVNHKVSIEDSQPSAKNSFEMMTFDGKLTKIKSLLHLSEKKSKDFDKRLTNYMS